MLIIFKMPSRVAEHKGIIRNIFGNNCTCANKGIITYGIGAKKNTHFPAVSTLFEISKLVSAGVANDHGLDIFITEHNYS